MADILCANCAGFSLCAGVLDSNVNEYRLWQEVWSWGQIAWILGGIVPISYPDTPLHDLSHGKSMLGPMLLL